MGLLNLCQSIFASSLQYSNIPFFFFLPDTYCIALKSKWLLHVTVMFFLMAAHIATPRYRGGTRTFARLQDWPGGGTGWVDTSECTCLKKTKNPENNKKKPTPKKTPQNCQSLLPQEIHLYEIKLDLIYLVTLLKSNICITMETSA